MRTRRGHGQRQLLGQKIGNDRALLGLIGATVYLGIGWDRFRRSLIQPRLDELGRVAAAVTQQSRERGAGGHRALDGWRG
jgi:hypothetical protein